MFAWLGAIKSLGTIASMVGKWVGWKKDRNLMDAGAARANEERNKEARDVEKRMDSVDRPASDDVTDSLHDGKF